jgi:hypothetical protein
MVDGAATDHLPHGGIKGESFGVVGVLIPGESAEHRLSQLGSKALAGVLAIPAIAKARFRNLGQSYRVVKLTIGEQSGIGGDRRTVELKAQLGVEIQP